MTHSTHTVHGVKGRLAHFTAAAITVASAAWSGSVIADDTEVFFPPVDVTDNQTVRPNIMFIMDTSGSMNGTDGKSKDRLERVQDALVQLLQQMNQNVNVGLMRLSDDEGGPVLWPVSHIEASAAGVEKLGSCSVADTGGGSTRPPIVGYAEDSGEWAFELKTSGTVVVNDAVLVAGGASGGTGVGGGASTTIGPLFPTNRYDDDEDENDSSGDASEYYTSDDDLDLGDVDSGVRFPSVAIPQGATIVDARVTFAQTDYNGQHQSNTDIDIYAHDVDNSSRINGGWNFDNLFNNRTSERVDWVGNGVFVDNGRDAIISTPNLAPVLQEIVDRPGWQDGNALTLLFDADGGHFSVWSYDGSGNSQSRRPALTISYSTGPVVSEPAMAGLRFNGVNIPQGTTVSSATLTVTPAGTEVGTADMTLYGEKSDNSAEFAATNSNLSSRSKTTESVDFDSYAWVAGQAVDIDVTDIVQEIANQSDWCGGSAISFLVDPESGNAATRVFETLLTNSSALPEFNVTLDTSDPQIDTGCQAQSVFYQIDDDDDDAEEESGGNVRMSSPDLDIQENPYIGLRFNNIRVLQDAEILDARIEFTALDDATAASEVEVYAELVDNADAIKGDDDELDDRFDSGHTNGVTWTMDVWNEGDSYVSPNLKDVVQEIVDLTGWEPGNSILFFIKQKSGSRRGAVTSTSASQAPRLSILARGGDPDSGALFETVRERLIDIVGDFDHVGYTPLAEVLTEAAYYYRGENVFFGRTRGSGEFIGQGNSGQDDLPSANKMRISHCSTYTGGEQDNPSGCSDDNPNDSDCSNQHIDGNPVYRTPMDQACQSNNIVLLSDGEPNNNTENGLIHQLIGKNSCYGASNGGCGVDLAEFLFKNDQSSTLDGDQTITTYTIGFGDVGSGVSGAEFLKDVAFAGGGDFFEAGDSDDLVQIFKGIVADILDKNTTFVAPAVTINSYNRLSHLDQLYFALFQPSSEPLWPGNLKRFKLSGEEGTEVILDADGNEAVDPTTGFFYEDARSYFSSTDDGGSVTDGGASEHLTATRKVYTNVAGNNLTDNGNRVHPDNTNITTNALGVDGEADASNLRKLVLNWARGIDVLDEDSDGSKTDARHSLGDPLHSEPVVVDYGGSETNPDLQIFMGSNQGYLHAFSSRTLQEEFAFVPKELLGNFYPYYLNRGSHKNRPYGVDGPIVSTTTESGAKMLIVGMRRGGAMYYALDISTRNQPKVKWVITPSSTGFSGLGQSWSTPQIAKVQIGASVKKVAIFGGGYDVAQDTPESAPITDSVGQMVYMVDLDTGSLIWSAGNLANSPILPMTDMKASIPGTPRAIDLDEDDVIDRMYVADTNGKVFRFDFFKKNTGVTDMAKGYLYATLGGSDAANNRRFYNDVDAAYIQFPDQDPLLTLSIGSGYRAHPLEEGVQDRFYVLKDYDVAPVSEVIIAADYRLPYFQRQQDFDVDLDGYIDTDEENITLGAISESELVDATDNTEEGQVKYGRARGGYIDMRDGEKVLTTSQTFSNTIIFSTFQPGQSTGNPCQAGEGIARTYFLDVLNLGPRRFSDDPPTKDRDFEMPQGSIPPDPAIFFPPRDDGGLPNEPVVCIGPMCYPLDDTLLTHKTFWRD